MKKKNIIYYSIVLSIVFLATFIFAQTVPAPRQAWHDFQETTQFIDEADGSLWELGQNLFVLKDFADSVLADQERLNNLKRIIELHPDYDLADITAAIQKFNALRNYLVENNYVIIE